ncbi:MAG: RdgB/HAM1 family non-canonical purine NTP pyrophosphatase [Taibaiella sp.]|nr:RdgB/HAM1 family non-canonical purine NTP pyrophosphatase [Taibaiella sp.]
MELVIASNNKGKIREILELLPDAVLLSLEDVGFTDDTPEPWHTFEENALAKASAVYAFCGKNVFADDSGICVNALDGRPGVDSAHFSGTRDDEQNLQHLLRELEGKDDRSAYYKAVICLIWNGEVYYFEGVCNGHIISEKRGGGGFGYDPVFVPDGFSHTFGELSPDVKNSISHRGRAVRKMVEFIKSKEQT